MSKLILRFLVVAAIAIALGLLIYHLSQPAGASSFAGGGLRDFGERDFGERGFSVARGLSGVAGDLVLVAIVTLVVTFLQKAFASNPRPARTR